MEHFIINNKERQRDKESAKDMMRRVGSVICVTATNSGVAKGAHVKDTRTLATLAMIEIESCPICCDTPLALECEVSKNVGSW
jgi:hypothetical protein